MEKAGNPNYPRAPIGSVKTLAKVLGVAERVLLKTAVKPDCYRKSGQKQKTDGSLRFFWEAREPLKHIQRRITDRILKVVEYPLYLQGALPGRDYVSNASIHAGRKAILSLDIRQFYPSCSEALIYSVWLRFFRFPPEVSTLLTRLTIRGGELPQGASTSSYLANLVFFSSEGRMVDRLESLGLHYTRFVDDITISSDTPITDKRKQLVIKSVLGLISPRGFGLHRGKLQIASRSRKMAVHRLNVKTNRPTLFGKKRRLIRALVGDIEARSLQSKEGSEYRKRFLSVRGQAALLKRFHRQQGQALLDRLSEIQPQPSEAEVVELRQAVRRFRSSSRRNQSNLKSQRDLERLKHKLGELKGFRPREAWRLRSELDRNIAI